MVAALALACGGAGCERELPPAGQEAAPRQEEAKSVNQELSVCAQAKDLAALDGKRIRLVGTYRKVLTRRKMRGPGEFIGEIAIELAGRAADCDPQAADSLPAKVEIGLRPPEEIEKLVDQRVRVDGRLELDPYKEAREAKVDYATVIFGAPQLQEVENVLLFGEI